MSKQVLIEYLPFKISPQSLMEAKLGPTKNLIVEGVVQRANSLNANRRVYPEEVLKREVEKYIAGPIAQNRALGELDHPDSSIINLNNVSHNIIDMEWKGNDLVGKVEVLTTPSGNILRELFRAGIKLGISSRGMGSVKQLDERTVEVQDDFELIAFDFVSNPSTHGAFLHPMNESKNHMFVDKYEGVNRVITDILTGFN